jgi:hypothetical protein
MRKLYAKYQLLSHEWSIQNPSAQIAARSMYQMYRIYIFIYFSPVAFHSMMVHTQRSTICILQLGVTISHKMACRRGAYHIVYTLTGGIV